MKSSNIAWVFGALSALSLGVAAEACSSSSSTASNDGGTMDSGKTGSGSGKTGSGTGTTGSGTGTTGSGTGTTGSGSGPKCYSVATKLYPGDGGSMYCPFDTTDAGKTAYCSSSEHCCEPSSGGSSCVANGTACSPATDTDWQCQQAADCKVRGTGAVCCGTGSIAQQSAQPGCAADGGTLPPSIYVSGFKGSSCAASCPSTEWQLCTTDAECPSGQMCVPMKSKGNDVGACQPGTGTGTGSGTGSSMGSGSGSSMGSGSGSSMGSGSGSGSHVGSGS